MSPEHTPGERPADRLSQPTSFLDLAVELAEIRAGDAYGRSNHAAKTLVKDSGLDVVLIAIRAGGEVPEHSAPCPIVIQVVEGEVAVTVESDEHELRPGHLLAVDTRLRHRLEASMDSAVLVTLARSGEVKP